MLYHQEETEKPKKLFADTFMHVGLGGLGPEAALRDGGLSAGAKAIHAAEDAST